MNITNVRIVKINKASGMLVGFASVTFDDCFVVNDIGILKPDDSDIFISMPSRKVSPGRFVDVAHPINSKTREMISRAIIDKYNEMTV